MFKLFRLFRLFKLFKLLKLPKFALNARSGGLGDLGDLGGQGAQGAQAGYWANCFIFIIIFLPIPWPCRKRLVKRSAMLSCYWWLSCCHFVVVYGLLMASPLRYTDETKILYTKWHIEYLLDMPNWLPETFEGQEGHPYIGDPYGHPTSYRMFECPAQACQFKVLVHTLSFRPIVALILALRRSPRSQRPKIFLGLKWFLLT